MNKNPVVHFEMPYTDGARASKFYEQSFGWKMNLLGKEMGDYLLAETTETDENNMVKTPGTINGGFFHRAGGSTLPSVVISVESITDGIQRVKEAGGAVLGEPMEIPGIGQYVSFNDTEGNRVGMLQPAQM